RWRRRRRGPSSTLTADYRFGPRKRPVQVSAPRVSAPYNRLMASLGGFERLIESLVERSLIAPLRGRVQPLEIAKRLERTMQERALVNVGTSIAPNEYVVRLHPEDFQPLAAARSMLERELARHLARIGAERGYAFLAPPIVR